MALPSAGPGMLKVGIAGFGNVGQKVSQSLLAGRIEGVELVAVSARELQKANVVAATMSPSPKVVPLSELAALCDVVVECATAASFPQIARAVLTCGKDLICVSAGGFLAIPDLAHIAKAHGARVQ